MTWLARHMAFVCLKVCHDLTDHHSVCTPTQNSWAMMAWTQEDNNWVGHGCLRWCAIVGASENWRWKAVHTHTRPTAVKHSQQVKPNHNWYKLPERKWKLTMVIENIISPTSGRTPATLPCHHAHIKRQMLLQLVGYNVGPHIIKYVDIHPIGGNALLTRTIKQATFVLGSYLVSI